MYYEINVSKEGVHLFATAERSLPTREAAKRVLHLFLEKFPKSEGFHVVISEWEKRGEGFTPDVFFAKCRE